MTVVSIDKVNNSLGETNPYASLFEDMISSAVAMGASDIHIQPDRSSVLIRFRIHGELVTWKDVSDVHKMPFLQEAKRLCRCSLAVAGKPQDVRFSVSKHSLDIRINLVPTLYGEKLVLRLLYQNRSFDLKNFKLEEEAQQAITSAISQNTGVCLMTGPTGSGKTTLLYSALNSIDRARLNVVTIEDPVEYSLPGISQIQVTPKISFADALRATLRQDPDVILVGEVRDKETAELCFQAASTGHLVLSTLHANNAGETLGRLQSLGVRDDLIKSCLRFSSAQRLVSELCPFCSTAATSLEGGRTRNESGCPQCRNGLIGVLPVFEYIEWSKESSSPTYSEPLRQSAIKLAQQGRLDIHEAMAV